MTEKEKIIVSAYTGVLMCDFDDLHEYIQKKFGRPVFTHELADKCIQKEVKEMSKEEFLEICNREEPERKKGKWIEKHHAYSDEESVIEEWQSCRCSECGRYDTRPYMYYFSEPNYCSYCGADMRGEDDERNR